MTTSQAPQCVSDRLTSGQLKLKFVSRFQKCVMKCVITGTQMIGCQIEHF